MSLQLLPLEESELPIFYQIVSEADGGGHFANAMWPNGYSQQAKDWSVKGSLEEMRDKDSSAVYMKVIDASLADDDDDCAKIISVAKWNVYPRDRTDEEKAVETDKTKARGMPPGSNEAFLNDFFPNAGKCKAEIVGNKAHVYLGMLFTRPHAGRRGAGKMHLDWGLSKADELGVPSYLESSPKGRLLYERNGFEYLRNVPMDYARWGFPEWYVATCHLRPAQRHVKSTVERDS